MCDRKNIDLSSRPINVAVGDATTTTFQVHEALLRARSPFFDAALSRNWKEGQQGRVDLPDDEPEVVNLYFQYLYSGKAHIDWTTNTDDLPKNNLLPEYVTLAHLYVFGEKVGDIRFKNAVVRSIIWRMENGIGNIHYYPIAEAVDIVYKGTTPECKLRKLFVDNFIAKATDKWIDSDLENNNHEFLCDLSRAMLRDRSRVYSPCLAEMKDGRYEESEEQSAGGVKQEK